MAVLWLTLGAAACAGAGVTAAILLLVSKRKR